MIFLEPSVSPGRGLLIPLGYLHPGKCEHSEVQSYPPCHGRTTNDERRTTVFVVMRMRESSLISKIWRTIMKSEHALKASGKGENEDKNDYKRLLRRDKCWKKTETTQD